MANIAPFRGLRYDPGVIGSYDQVVGPPYDLVKDDDKDRYRARHECNVIRLLYCQDPAGRNHVQAAEILKAWCSRGLLVRDRQPAIYLYQIDYRIDAQSPRLTRTGFIALLRLQDYQMGMIRPHERTFSAIKDNQLDWLTQCQAHLSQILTFYDDPEQEVTRMLTQAAPGRPDLEFDDLEGVSHRLWVITDAAVHLRVARLLEPKQIYIADGHHRYETCLDHRDMMRRSFPEANPLSPFNYTLVYSAAMQDPGLAILPAHRLFKELPGFTEEEFLRAAERYFSITEMDLSEKDAVARFRERLIALAGRTKAYGFLAGGSNSLKLLTLKPDILPGLQLHPALKDLDVAVLREIVFRRCLRLNQEARNNEKLFAYDFHLGSAVRRVREGEARLCFLLNPTQVAQVKAVADAGLVMPRKSTLFYPKVSTGLAINPMPPDELVADPLLAKPGADQFRAAKNKVSREA